MDTERFIPCLIRTTTGYLKRLHKLYNEHRSAIQSLQYFPERLCWNGKRTYCRNLYGTNVEFRVSEDPDINWFSREVTGLILEVTFQVDDIEIRIIFNSSDDCEKIIEKIPHRKIETVEDFRILVDGEGEYQFGEKRFVLRSYTSKEIFVFPESTARFAYVDLSKVKMPLVLRNRKDGDVINPFGMNGTMKLKKYLNSKGVSRHRRDELLLLANEDEILWVVGVGLCDKIAVTTHPTHVIEVL